MLEYLRMADELKPKWIVWENVPGVLSSNKGRDFGTFLTALGEIGYGFAYRVLDAQYFGVAQRRRRVFVVGYLGDWRRAAAVLFEPESLSGHPAPSREPREEIAQCLTTRTGSAYDPTTETLPIAFPAEMSGTQAASAVNISPALSVKHTTAVTCWSIMPMNSGKDYKARITDVAQPIMAGGPVGGNQGGDFIQHGSVRRLTPTECERLQGFPDDYTQIPWRNKAAEDCPDGPRYKAMGNSMAVPVMRWIGERIQKTYST